VVLARASAALCWSTLLFTVACASGLLSFASTVFVRVFVRESKSESVYACVCICVCELRVYLCVSSLDSHTVRVPLGSGYLPVLRSCVCVCARARERKREREEELVCVCACALV